MKALVNKRIALQLIGISFLMVTMVFGCSSDEDSQTEPETNNPTLTTVALDVFRSEYEQVDDIIYDIDDISEGMELYEITTGNEDNYFEVNPNTGQLIINTIIEDVFDEVHEAFLTISIGNTNYEVSVYDMFDYHIANLPFEAVVLQEHNENTVDFDSEWTVINNLWGRGDAVPNQDFRIATIHYADIPNGTELIWDVPSRAEDFNGASVWNYNNVFWGNRNNVREDLVGFPFQIQSISELKVNFDFEQLYGNDQFKIAMNMFMTDESELTNFFNNDGDFFFVFDQKDTFIPNYTNTLPDITIDGKPFALRYDLNPTNQYERRRVIIKDNERFMQGQLDVNALFNMFIDENFLNPEQYIYHIQFGIEVTSGFGALRFNALDIEFEQ